MSEAAPGDRQAEHEALLKRMGNGRRLEWDEEGGRAAAEFTASENALLCRRAGRGARVRLKAPKGGFRKAEGG